MEDLFKQKYALFIVGTSKKSRKRIHDEKNVQKNNKSKIYIVKNLFSNSSPLTNVIHSFKNIM